MKMTEEINSITGKTWQFQKYNEAKVNEIINQYALPDIVAKLLSQKNIPLDQIGNYLNPKIKTAMPDPFHLKDMDKATEIILPCIKEGKKIGIFGDYDVDGAASTALLINYLRSIGHNQTTYHIPDREKEGYGPNFKALKKMKEENIDLVILVDCGTTAFEELEKSQSLDQDIIIIDHHEGETKLPKANAVINPKRLDETSPLTYLCAAGLTYLFIIALNKKLRENQYFKERKEPDLLQFLDLISLATVCDVVPITGLNRAFIKTGLKVMAKRNNLGLKKLSDIADLSSKPTPYHLGFILGPRINAGGRVGTATLGTQLLTATDELIAEKIAAKLDELNKERRAIEETVLLQAYDQIEESYNPNRPLIYAYKKNWHKGVVGIAAGRIKEKYNLPTLIAGINKEGIAEGSGRSIENIDLGRIIIKAKEQNLLVAGGGHAMACGFSCKEEQMPAFLEFVEAEIRSIIKNQPITQTLKIDAELSIDSITQILFNKIKQLEPFGPDNEEPVFSLSECKITSAKNVGSNGTIIAYLKSKTGKSLKAIKFRAADTEIGRFLLENPNKTVKIAGKIKENTYQGKTNINFHIIDIAY